MAKEEKGEVIDLRDKAEAIATGKTGGFHTKGEVINAHPKTIDYFVKHGYAVKKGSKAAAEE